MTRATWPLINARPAMEVELVAPDSAHGHRKTLLADTGAGPATAPFELLLDEQDCVLAAHGAGQLVALSGAYSGEFRTYVVAIRIPTLDFAGMMTAVGIERPPAGFDGIAAFRFLNRFTYGNFGRPDQFGLEAIATE